MGAIDTDSLLQAISSDLPCGEDLEYDPAFIELETIARGKAEQQIGDSVIEAEGADWKQVRKQSLELLSRTKDIRVLVYLMRATLNMDGLPSFRDTLTLLKGLLTQHWEQIHPQLDEDDGDPTMRINALITLCDEESLLRPLRNAPLVQSRMLGNYGLRDIAIAAGEIKAPAGYDHVEQSTIDGAFMDADLDDLQATADAVSESIDHVNEIENFVTTQVGVANAASFADLVSVLKEARQVLDSQLQKRGVGQEPEADSGASDASAVGNPGNVTTTTGANRPTAPSLSGEITSRDDVIRALDKIADYYTHYEPTSPIPLLLSRTRRLVRMNFMEIMKDIAPDGISQVEMIRGPEDNDSYTYSPAPSAQTAIPDDSSSSGSNSGADGSDW
jgi:type VI secretion system protein ImpA